MRFTGPDSSSFCRVRYRMICGASPQGQSLLAAYFEFSGPGSWLSCTCWPRPMASSRFCRANWFYDPGGAAGGSSFEPRSKSDDASEELRVEGFYGAHPHELRTPGSVRRRHRVHRAAAGSAGPRSSFRNLRMPAQLPMPQALSTPGEFELGWRSRTFAPACRRIYLPTRETFVAQMLNSICWTASAFTKGCYTGQEINRRAPAPGPHQAALGPIAAAPGAVVHRAAAAVERRPGPGGSPK